MVENSLQEYTIGKIPKDKKEMIIEFPKKINKLKLKINPHEYAGNDGIIQTDINIDKNTEIENIPEELEKEEKKKLYNEYFNSKCAKPKFLTEYWRSIFPKRTNWIIFNKQISQCNFNLFIFILKAHDYEKYKNISVETIKYRLIKYYKKYVFDVQDGSGKKKLHIKKLEKKLRKEGKPFIDVKNAPIETIIRDENYVLTPTDIMLYSYVKEIPIVIYYESKGNVKLSNYKQNNSNKLYYFIYYSSRTNDLYLTTRNKSLVFEESILGEKITQSIQNHPLEDFNDYLVTNV